MQIKILFTFAHFMPVFCRDTFRIDSASEPKERQRIWHRHGDLWQKPRSILSEVEAFFPAYASGLASRANGSRRQHKGRRHTAHRLSYRLSFGQICCEKGLFHPRERTTGRQKAPFDEPSPCRNGIFSLKIHKCMPQKKAPTTRENTKYRHIPYPEDGFLEGKTTVTPQTTGKRQDSK